MPPERRRIADAELAVMELLWSEHSLTIRQITAAIYPSGSTSEYSTVQKLLERLEAKNCVTRDRSTVPHVYSAIVEREEIIGERLEEVAEKLCDGSLTPLLLHLTANIRLRKHERELLRKLIDDSQ